MFKQKKVIRLTSLNIQQCFLFLSFLKFQKLISLLYNNIKATIFMQPERKEEQPLIEEAEPEEKRILLVVGKMGSGKSSLIRSLMTPKGSKDLLVGEAVPLIKGDLKSCTIDPGLFRVHQSHDFTGDGKPLYVLDTQGLDSQEAAAVILEEVDTFIQKQNLKIVGIAYVISDREQGGDGSSHLKTFLRILKLKPKYKNALFFCVYTKWFNSITGETCKSKKESLDEFLKKLNFPDEVFKKTVYWESGPNNSKGYKKIYKEIQDQEEKQYEIAFNQQWNQLKKNLSSQVKNACPVSQYIANYLEFWKILKAQINQQQMAVGFSKNAWEKGSFSFYQYVWKDYNSFLSGAVKAINKGIIPAVKYLLGVDKGFNFSKGDLSIDQVIQQKFKKRMKLIRDSMIYEQIMDSNNLTLNQFSMQLKLLKKSDKVHKISVFQEVDSQKKFIAQLTVETPLKLVQKGVAVIPKERKFHFVIDASSLDFISFNKIYMQVLERYYGK